MGFILRCFIPKNTMKKAILVLAVLITARVLATNPLIPMTAITGKPTRNDISRLLNTYHDAGIEQFLIYPRSGLELEYMSEDWITFCRNAAQIADSLGMKIWLYDEYNWPSGNCKGQVTADGHEDLYPNVLMFDNDGNGVYSTRIVRNRVGADILNPDAVARFIALTHERYYASLGEYFGKVITAIFTDEPSFCYSINSAKGVQEANFTGFDNNHFGLAWYDGLESDYADACGRNLHEDVDAYLHGKAPEELWTTYYTLMGNRMRSVYVRTLADWCKDHGIALTGHLMYEKVYKSVRCNGNPLKTLSLFDIPGFDEANSDIDINALEMEISGLSLAQYAGRGKQGEMCELYSVGPADLTLSHQRQLMWMCAAYGINNYVVAVSAMDARGNREKGDWYYSSGPAQPWFSYYREFGEEAAKAAGFARKPYVPDVYIRVPFTYFMSLDKTPDFERQGLRYLRFLEDLLKYQVQYMFLDEDESAPDSKPVLSFSHNGFYIEGDPGVFDKPDKFLEHLNGKVRRRLVVTDEEGHETRDVLVRLWGDGTITLVDITDNDKTDRLLDVRLDGRTSQVRLTGHGAFAGTPGNERTAPAATLDCGKIKLRHPVMTPEGPNLVRCCYRADNPEFIFNVTDDIGDVRLVLRHDVDRVLASIDGVPVEAEEPCGIIPESFRQLYRSSAPFKLTKGRHVLRIDNGVTDYRYLPGAFLAGEFAYSHDRTVSPWDGRGILSTAEALPDYPGTYDIKADIDIPRRPSLILSLNTNLACTEVLIDDVSLGRKAWAPYEWDVPEALQGGRHTLTVHISTSVMPLFGDLSIAEEEQPYVAWMRIRPGQHGDKTTTGIFNATWKIPVAASTPGRN